MHRTDTSSALFKWAPTPSHRTHAATKQRLMEELPEGEEALYAYTNAAAAASPTTGAAAALHVLTEPLSPSEALLLFEAPQKQLSPLSSSPTAHQVRLVSCTLDLTFTHLTLVQLSPSGANGSSDGLAGMPRVSQRRSTASRRRARSSTGSRSPTRSSPGACCCCRLTLTRSASTLAHTVFFMA